MDLIDLGSVFQEFSLSYEKRTEFLFVLTRVKFKSVVLTPSDVLINARLSPQEPSHCHFGKSRNCSRFDILPCR